MVNYRAGLALVSRQDVVSVWLDCFVPTLPGETMKLATSENLPAPEHPLDMLEQAVEENGWPFERAARGGNKPTGTGRWGGFHFFFTWGEGLQALHVLAR